MEGRLIVLLILFCGCYSLTAQKVKDKYLTQEVSTKYFDARISGKEATLYPKDMVYPEVEMPFKNNYRSKDFDKMFIESYKLYKKVFDKLTPEEEKALWKTTIMVTFNSSLKVVYFRIYYPDEAWDQLPGLEKRLHLFGHAFEHFDLHPYVKVLDKDLFKIAPFAWQMRLFIQYDKSHNMKYMGGSSLYILPAKQ